MLLRCILVYLYANFQTCTIGFPSHRQQTDRHSLRQNFLLLLQIYILPFCSRIYNLQENGYAYTTVDQLLNSLNPAFMNMTKTSISKVLLEKGYSQKFLDEFVQAVMMVNYGQTNDITGLVGKFICHNLYFV